MLEIRVFDEVKIAESFEEALSILAEEFKKWRDSGAKRKLKISIKSLANKAPPALGINVADGIETKEAIG